MISLVTSLTVLSILSTFLHPQTNGSCPLHLASAGGHTQVVKVLLEAGASVAEEDAVSDGENTQPHLGGTDQRLTTD